VYADVGIYILM